MEPLSYRPSPLMEKFPSSLLSKLLPTLWRMANSVLIFSICIGIWRKRWSYLHGPHCSTPDLVTPTAVKEKAQAPCFCCHSVSHPFFVFLYEWHELYHFILSMWEKEGERDRDRKNRQDQRGWGLNPEPCAWYSNILPLSSLHDPSTSFWACDN